MFTKQNNKKRLGLLALNIIFSMFFSHLIFADWTPRKLIGSYPNWDYWWLNTRFGIDSFDTLYCAVARYNYSSMNDPEHDLYILNTEGDVIRALSPWHGYQYQPIVQDAAGNNIYLSQPVLGFSPSGQYHMDWGVTDDSNQIHTCRGGTWGQGVFYTKLAPDGSIIYGNVNIYIGYPWNGKTCMAIDSRNYLYITWADSLEFLVYAKSSDGGVTWIFDTLWDERVLSQPKVVCDPNDNLHFIWRTWTSGCELHYMKLRADASCAVGNSIFAAGAETWDPYIAIDQSNNIHVVYTTATTYNQQVYYTVVTGNLDKNGQPASDSELTVVKDTMIQYDAVGIAYPKIVIDSQERPHVIFEQGQYGNNTSKAVYHIRGDPVGGVEEIASRSTPDALRLEISPNPFSEKTEIRYRIHDTGYWRGEAEQDISESVGGISEDQQSAIKIYDATGRLVKDFSRSTIYDLRTTQAVWDGADDAGHKLPAGIYFCQLKYGDKKGTRKMIKLQ